MYQKTRTLTLSFFDSWVVMVSTLAMTGMMLTNLLVLFMNSTSTGLSLREREKEVDLGRIWGGYHTT